MNRRNTLLAALTILAASANPRAAHAAEGFGMFEKVVAMDRLSPPEVALAAHEVRLAFDDTTARASALQKRIEALIRAGDPNMRLTATAPFVLTVHVRSFLDGKTHHIEGTARLSDRADRELRETSFSASNAGALVSDSDEQLIEDAAATVVRTIVPLRVSSATVVPKGRLEPFIEIASRGDWPVYLAAVERLPALQGAPESYREYALAVGHEGTAYKLVASGDLEKALAHLRLAVAHNLAASRLNPSEKLFSNQFEPLRRAFSHPGTPPCRWLDPHEMERWESLLRIHAWSAAPSSPEALDNHAILDRLVAGRSDAEILSAIREAKRIDFHLDDSDMTALRSAGLNWDLIDAMRTRAGLGRRPFRITPDSW